jgi:hypothetical protein
MEYLIDPKFLQEGKTDYFGETFNKKELYGLATTLMQKLYKVDYADEPEESLAATSIKHEV